MKKLAPVFLALAFTICVGTSANIARATPAAPPTQAQPQSCSEGEHSVCDGWEDRCTDVQVCDEYGENHECLHYHSEMQCTQVCTHYSCVPN